jgi:transcriptional regulator of aromatic amino acid metabolism
MNHKLEAELKSAEATIQSLQDTIASSHVKCEELLAELTELKEGRDKSLEMHSWQSQVRNLEETLENAKFESEKKAKLYEELELAKTQSDKRTESTKYILPAATATGALVATGLMLVIKAVSR